MSAGCFLHTRGLPHHQPLAVHEALGVVQQCLAKRDVDAARRVQTLLVSNGLDQVDILKNHLIRWFSSCGSLQEASALFLQAAHPSLHSWHAIISAHLALGQPIKALNLYHTMQLGLLPDKVIFLSALKTCGILADVGQGMLIHDQILRILSEIDTVLCSSLIDMYSKCGFLKEAWTLFDQSENRDVVIWGAIITGCSQHEYNHLVLELYEKMVQEGIQGDRVLYLCTLKACNNVIQGNVLYDQAVRTGYEADVIVASGLVGFYAKCGSLKEAHKVFSRAPHRDVVLYSAMIGGLADIGEGVLALECFQKMQQDGEAADAILFLSVLNACGCVREVDLGRFVHDQLIRNGLNSEVEIANTTIDMYIKCGSIEEGRRVFECLHNRTAVSWDIIITGYAQCGQSHTSLELFERMQVEGLMPASSTCCWILKTCCGRTVVSSGRMIHSRMVKCGTDADLSIGNALVYMYGKNECLVEAQYVFDRLLVDPDVVSWSVLITGYTEAGLGTCALNIFGKMQEDGLMADEYTYSCVLKASGSMQSVDLGRLIHEETVRRGFDIDTTVQGALIDMYLKCGSFEDADKVFEKGFLCDVVSWNTLIGGCLQHEQGDLALDRYIQMRHQNVVPDVTTLLCISKACGSTGAIDMGKLTHVEIIESNLESDSAICNALIDMYGKCGMLHEARKIFECFLDRNVISWNALIAGYSQHGLFEQALQCLKDMKQQDCKPSSVTYVSVLAACSHACEAEHAFRQFASMRGEYGITPTLEHFDCLVDLLGRGGYLQKAEELLQTMPNFLGKHGLTSLLSACKVYDNVELGKRCFEQVAVANSTNAPSYMPVSNIL